MTNAELLAMLTATIDRDAIDFDPNDNDAAYVDWSTTVDGLDGRRFEFGQEGECAVLDLTWAQIARLQQALTVLLLEH